MKTEFVRKVMIVGLAMLIGGAVCVSVWLFFREYKGRELQGQNSKIAAYNQTPLQSSQESAGNIEEDPLTRGERVTQQASSMFTSSLSEEQLATPFAQKMLNAMNSPEYLALLESDFTEQEWNNFLESQGVEVIRGHSGLFQKFVPNMELGDYEPVVRQKFAELFIAAEPVNPTDPAVAADQRSSVFLELGKELTQTDMATAAWFMETFGEDREGAFRWEGVENNPAFIWMTDVQRNAARIVEAAEAAGGDVRESQGAVPSWDMSSVMENPSASHSETEVPATPDTSGSVLMTDAEIEAEIEKSLASQPREVLPDERPDTPGEIQSNLEITLKAQFSSERFEQAMSTLDQYGPEEGLRRLRENDPEVAKQIERHHKRGKVSQ